MCARRHKEHAAAARRNRLAGRSYRTDDDINLLEGVARGVERRRHSFRGGRNSSERTTQYNGGMEGDDDDDDDVGLNGKDAVQPAYDSIKETGDRTVRSAANGN